MVFASGTLGRGGSTPKDLDYALDYALQQAGKQEWLPDNFKFGIGTGLEIDQGDGHNMNQTRSTELGAMLDAGRSRRLQKDKK